MSENICLEFIKKDIQDALNTPNVTFDQVHTVLRLNLEKLWFLDEAYHGVIKKYRERELDLLAKIKDAGEELRSLQKQLASNDEKLYEAIQKL